MAIRAWPYPSRPGVVRYSRIMSASVTMSSTDRKDFLKATNQLRGAGTEG
jgi:hypothetical protein